MQKIVLKITYSVLEDKNCWEEKECREKTGCLFAHDFTVARSRKRTFEHRIKGSEDANSDTVWTNNVTDFSKY